MKNNKYKVSVIIVNYNNSKYITRSIKSALKQSYKNTEIIFVDDLSYDNSFSIAKKFKNIKVYRTTKKLKSKYGSYNQINAINCGLKNSKGDIIFFLDSDDFFKKNKITYFMKYMKNKKIDLCMDKPIFYNTKKNFELHEAFSRNKYIVPWPKISPQSCLAVKKKYLLKILKKITIKKFPDIWFDFRIINQTIIDSGNIKIIPKHLTYYQQHRKTISSDFKKFSKNWWLRRSQAHEFIEYLQSKNKKNKFISIDKFFTVLINKFFK